MRKRKPTQLTLRHRGGNNVGLSTLGIIFKIEDHNYYTLDKTTVITSDGRKGNPINPFTCTESSPLTVSVEFIS